MRELTISEVEEVSGGNVIYVVAGIAALGMMYAAYTGGTFSMNFGSFGFSLTGPKRM